MCVYLVIDTSFTFFFIFLVLRVVVEGRIMMLYVFCFLVQSLVVVSFRGWSAFGI